jgi:LSD1 subclass zinc finger protein
MNCTNCGGPLELVEGREHLRCPFCTAICLPADLELSADRVAPLGRETGNHCPACDSPLQVGRLDGCLVECCATCGGLLVATTEFACVVQKRRAAYAGADRRPVPLAARELERRLTCPRCAEPMEVHPYYGPGNVVIDSCPGCRIVWLDHGEMAAIETAPGRR